MQGLRKGEWSAITQVKVLSPEICLVALGQGFHYLEASSAARDNGECGSDVPGSESMAGHSMIHSGTWDSHVVLKRSLHQAEEARRGYGGMAIGPCVRPDAQSRCLESALPVDSSIMPALKDCSHPLAVHHSPIGG